MPVAAFILSQNTHHPVIIAGNVKKQYELLYSSQASNMTGRDFSLPVSLVYEKRQKPPQASIRSFQTTHKPLGLYYGFPHDIREPLVAAIARAHEVRADPPEIGIPHFPLGHHIVVCLFSLDRALAFP